MSDIEAFLGAEREGDQWRFHIGRELHGAFGGAFGGVLAACTLLVARSAVGGREPTALDCRFVRGLPAGTASAVPTVVHAGRSHAVVSVELLDGERLVTRATVSLVDPEVLHPLDRQAESVPGGWTPFDEAPPWPEVAPIVSALGARTVGPSATAVRVPWDGDGHSPEAACLAADMSMGPSVAEGVAGESISHPNPDLSLRFCGEVTTDHVVGHGRLRRAHGGVAAVAIEVWSGPSLAAVGAATSLLLPSG